MSVDTSKVAFSTPEEGTNLNRILVAKLKTFIKDNTGLKSYVLIDRKETFTKNLLANIENYYFIKLRITQKYEVILAKSDNNLSDQADAEVDIIENVEGKLANIIQDTTIENIANKAGNTGIRIFHQRNDAVVII